MFKLVDNTEYDVSSWGPNARGSISLNSQVDALGIENSAHRVSQASSGNFNVAINSLYTNFDITSKTSLFGVNLKSIQNIDTVRVQIVSTDNNVKLCETDVSIDNNWTSYVLSCIPTSMGSGFRVVMSVTSLDDSVTRVFDFSADYVIVSSLNSIEINPNYDYEEAHEKIENRHRVRSGEEYVYKWGEFKKFSMGVSYVNSGFKSIANSYWNNNAELMFVQSGALEVSSVRIINGSLPVGSVIPPYTDLFSGIIELETY